MTSSQQDTTPSRRPLELADERPAGSARQDGARHTLSAEDGAPSWNPEDGDYS
jgi:hypothetical protein